jgi:shikimate kinase
LVIAEGKHLVTEQKSNLPSGLGRRRAVFLVGFMGAGKTTVGSLLAQRLHWKFIDLDDVVVASAGKTVSTLFQEEGEARFRELETAALRHVLEQKIPHRPTVVALGGGAFVQPANLDLIRASQHPTIFLDAEVEELRKRCAPAMGSRPLFQDENQFRQLYEARRSSYMEADLRVDTAGKAVGEIVNEVISRLGLDDEFTQQAPRAR